MTRLDCPACRGSGWIEDPETRSPIAKCTSCSAPPSGLEQTLTSPDAPRVRGAIEDRARSAGEFTIEDVLAAAFGEDTKFGNVAGAVTAALSREGVIVRVGYCAARRASRASGTVTLWTGRGGS